MSEESAFVGLFRELFVEVPLALLEAKVLSAMPPAPIYTPRWTDYLACRKLEHIVVELSRNMLGLKWSYLEQTRDAETERTVVKVRLPCNHVGRIWIDELPLLMLRNHDVIEYIAHELETQIPDRRCSCVQRCA